MIRHAIAEDLVPLRKKQGKDRDRRLTGKGKKRFRAEITGLKLAIGKADGILASPFRRTKKTAELLQRAYPKTPVQLLEFLAPGGSPSSLLRWLKSKKAGGNYVVVGHEPEISRIVGYFCWGKISSRVRIKKGALCILQFSDKIMPGKAEIECLMQPQTLRSLKA